jgi:hypothetical protein
MRGKIRPLVVAAPGLVLLSLPLLQLAWTRPPAPHSAQAEPLFVATSPFVRANRRGPVDQALREAAAYETQAQQVAHDVDEGPATWEAEAAGSSREISRRQLAFDGGGYLRAARRVARRAAALARTPEEAYRVTLLRAHLECLAGHHATELRLARRLVDLAPGDPAAWRCLRHAVTCNDLEPRLQ